MVLVGRCYLQRVLAHAWLTLHQLLQSGAGCDLQSALGKPLPDDRGPRCLRLSLAGSLKTGNTVAHHVLWGEGGGGGGGEGEREGEGERGREGWGKGERGRERGKNSLVKP